MAFSFKGLFRRIKSLFTEETPDNIYLGIAEEFQTENFEIPKVFMRYYRKGVNRDIRKIRKSIRRNNSVDLFNAEMLDEKINQLARTAAAELSNQHLNRLTTAGNVQISANSIIYDLQNQRQHAEESLERHRAEIRQYELINNRTAGNATNNNNN